MEIVESTMTTKETTINEKEVAKLESKFTKAQKAFEDQDYSVSLTKETMKFVKTDFAEKIRFKGYSSYGITEVYNAVETLKEDKKTGDFTGKWKREFVEALFHFIKEFEGMGLEMAKSHRDLSDQIAPIMQKVQQNMQNLKDLATELEAARQGITPEELIASVQQGPK